MADNKGKKSKSEITSADRARALKEAISKNIDIKLTSSNASTTKKSTAKSSTKKSKVTVSTSNSAVNSAVSAIAKSKNTTLKIVALVLVVVILGVLLFGYFYGWFDEYVFAWFYTPSAVVSGELTIHFLELGNKYTGDSVYIKAGDVDILVDAGSRAGSAPIIQKYVNEYCTDGVLEYVIATHADQDHIAAFAASTGIFDMYECEVIIDFPQTDKATQVLKSYIAKRDAEVAAGATHYTALEAFKEQKGAKRVIELTEGIELEILYHEFYENKSADENNYSVCFVINQGDRHFLFTGDLEKEGEQSLVEENTLPKVELFKAGHHGSKTSSNDKLLDVIQPKIVCVCCCAGSDEYTKINANKFPTQDMINRVGKHTDAIYVTTLSKNGGFEAMNGNIRVVSNAGADVYVDCSNNNTKLFDTDWFKANRSLPTLAQINDKRLWAVLPFKATA